MLAVELRVERSSRRAVVHRGARGGVADVGQQDVVVELEPDGAFPQAGVKHRQERYDAPFDTRLFEQLTPGRLGERLAGFDEAAWQGPEAVVPTPDEEQLGHPGTLRHRPRRAAPCG